MAEREHVCVGGYEELALVQGLDILVSLWILLGQDRNPHHCPFLGRFSQLSTVQQ
jgi:hypothetical protein